jgi:tetratricopeptide (TPR) repeat protein
MITPGRDFASPALASARPRSDAPGVRSAWRRTACRALAGSLLLAGMGCSSLGFLPGMDDGGKGRAVKPGELGDALARTRASMALAPSEPYWPFRLGELYVAADSTAQAVRCLETALEIDPAYAPAASLLSKVYYEARMHAQAVELLDAFLARNPAAPDAVRAALAIHLEAIGEIDRAQAALDGCAPDAKDARGARALVSMGSGDPRLVLETARRALDADGNSAANHNNYGIALLYAGRPVEAREAFRAALERNERLPGALYNMAIVETFYFFDEEAGRQWFARYKQYASDDPDGLAARLAADVTKTDRARN